MEATNFKKGQTVNYTNGHGNVYTGKIVKIKSSTLVVINVDNLSELTLWKMGYATEITFNQVKY